MQCDTENFVLIVDPGLSTSSSSSSHPSTSRTTSRQERPCSTSSSNSSSSPTTSSSDNVTREKEDRTESDTSPVLVLSFVMIERGHPLSAVHPITNKTKPTKNKLPKTNKMATMIGRGNPMYADSGHASSEIPEWENLVDDEVPEHRDSHASSSHEVSLEPMSTRAEDLGKHSVCTHFPKDRDCEICQRTKIKRAPCRRRNGGAVPRAANFGDLITADHKVLSENCESRNNHRFAVVVQDSATQWIQSFPCKTKTSQETQRSLQIPAWNMTKVRSKKEVIDEARTKGAKVHFASLMDICHLKNAELEEKHQKYKGRVVFRGDIVKDDSGSYAAFIAQGSSASQMTAAKVMDIISRLPGCAAVSANTQVKMDAPKLLEIPISECPDNWIRLPRHKWPISWSSGRPSCSS